MFADMECAFGESIVHTSMNPGVSPEQLSEKMNISSKNSTFERRILTENLIDKYGLGIKNYSHKY